MKDSEKRTHVHHASSGNISGVVLGIAIGAAVTYLFANRDGQRIRDVLLKEGAKLLDEAAKKAQEMEESVVNQEVGRELVEKIENVKKGVQEIEQMVEEVPTHIEQIQKKGRRFFFKRHGSTES